jgi:hypothetical protein
MAGSLRPSSDNTASFPNPPAPTPEPTSPLPVRISSGDNYLSTSFVLAPGDYSVSYTASGTCDFTAALAINGGASVPLVQRRTESEAVDGSVSVTILKLGSYFLSPAGSDGCDSWSVTISRP